MVGFLNKLKVSYQNFLTNGNIRDENYWQKLLFSMNDFVSFSTDCQSIYFMLTIFLKNKINVVRVTPFKLSYNHDTSHPSQRKLVKVCCELHYMW